MVDRRRKLLSTSYASCGMLEVVCEGAGPVGLRTAIEMALLGAQVKQEWKYSVLKDKSVL